MNKNERQKCIYEASNILHKVIDHVNEYNKNLPKELILLENQYLEYIPTSFEIADTFNIHYEFIQLNGTEPSYYDNKLNTIYISNSFRINSYEAKFLCAHELGHYFMQKNCVNAAMNNDVLNMFLPAETAMEYEANVFALLLMPQFMAGQPWEDYSPYKLNREIYNKIYKKGG